MVIYFNMLPKEIEGVELKDCVNKRYDSEHIFRYDVRTGTLHLIDEKYPINLMNYPNYLNLLNETAMQETNKYTNGQKMLLAGFIPLVAEPSFGNGTIYNAVHDKLMSAGLPFKEIFPQTFSAYDKGFNKAARDIWVHRMDGKVFLNAPNVYQVSTRALLKALNV